MSFDVFQRISTGNSVHDLISFLVVFLVFIIQTIRYIKIKRIIYCKNTFLLKIFNNKKDFFINESNS